MAAAYKRILPGVKVHLAFLTWRDESDPLVDLLRQAGDVTLFRPVTDVPEFAQAKMIRFILASRQERLVTHEIKHLKCYFKIWA